MFKDIVDIMQFDEIVWGIGAGVIVLFTLVQALPIKFNPWTYLIRQFGQIMNHDVMEKMEHNGEKIDRLENKMQNMEIRIENMEALRGMDKAMEARRRILRFADEIRMGEYHSKEYFNDIMEDINTYNNYCRENADFKNERAVVSIGLLEKVYAECLEKDNFLRRGDK